jgi:DNA-binding transcriptional LysR family regulator
MAGAAARGSSVRSHYPGHTFERRRRSGGPREGCRQAEPDHRGDTTGIVVTPAVQDLRRRHPDADVRTLHLAWHQPRPALLDYRVEAAVARLPFPTDRLYATVLYDEPRVLLVPRDHRLAGRPSVTLDDVAGEPMPREPDPIWSAFWRVDPRPDGTPAPDGPLVDALEDRLELIAGGQAVAIASAGLRGDSLRPDLTTVPLEGVEPGHVVLATRRGDRSSLVVAVRAAAQRYVVAPNTAIERHPPTLAPGPTTFSFPSTNPPQTSRTNVRGS